MTRRLALSLLTVLALLWQAAASVAMGAAMALPPPALEAAADTPCHDMAGMDEADSDHQLTQDCCGSSGHCVCAAACGTAALPGAGFTLNLLPSPDVKARAIVVLRDTAPPHPFRPPIVSAV